MRRIAIAAGMAATLGVLVFSGLALAGKGLTNGNFETGTFKGWTHGQEGGSGNWFVYKGRPTFGDLLGTPTRRGITQKLPKPRQGKYAAATAQGGPGTRLLFHKLTLKPNVKRKLSFLMRYTSDAAIHDRNTLHAAGLMSRTYGKRGVVVDHPNQQFRVDLMRPGADKFSLKQADILKTLYATETGDSTHKGWKRYDFDLSGFDPGKAKLRAVEVDNQGTFVAALDDLKLNNKHK
jgi:hypothetical protein